MSTKELNIPHPDYPHLLISTSRALLDIPAIHATISQTYWAENIPYSILTTSIEHSLCIGIYDTSVQMDGKPKQIAFARWVTDYASFGWLSDVYVLDEYKRRGLGKWLVQTAVNMKELKDCRRLMLMTRDAEGLYEKYGGFVPVKGKALEVKRDLRSLCGDPDKESTQT